MTGLPDPDPRVGPGVEPAIDRFASGIGDASPPPPPPSPETLAISFGRAATGGAGGCAGLEEEEEEEAEAEAEEEGVAAAAAAADGEGVDAACAASLPRGSGGILSSKKPGVGRVGGISAGGHGRIARLSRRILKEHCSDALTVMTAPALMNCPQ